VLRVTLIHLLLLFAPTAIYVGYLLVIRKLRPVSKKNNVVTKKLPFFTLIAVGLILVVASLVSLSFSSGSAPEGNYTPPYIKNGSVVSGQVE
tara:strand:+ start:412 stop:687 length:276 start_codon:yes stop_codon:yes gene_type:complete